MQKIITESAYPDRDAQIVECLKATNAKEVGEMFGLSAGTIRKIARRVKESEVYDLSITDGLQTVPVGQIVTSQGFLHACKRALREYSAFFSRLELPQWRLVAGDESINLRALTDE